MLRTPEDIATRDLYRFIHTYEENTLYEDIKDCIQRGAKLVGIEASYGIPLLYAIRSGCDISIIKLLVDSGGYDLNYYSYEQVEVDLAEYKPNDLNTDAKNDRVLIRVYSQFLRCMTFQNELLQMYHTSFGSKKLSNKLLIELAKRDCCIRMDDLQYVLKDTPEVLEPTYPVLYEYTKQCCELLGISFDSLKTAEETFVSMEDFHTYHLIPKDKHPYNWTYTLDVYNIENNIEDSSEDENE